MLENEVIGINKLCIGAFLVLLLSSCTVPVIPQPPPLDHSVAVDLHANHPVSVVNDQPSEEVIVVGTAGWGTFTANLNEWTGSAVDLIKSELTKRSVQVTESAQKSLKLAITTASLEGETTSSSCVVELRVEMADGRTVTVSGTGRSLQPDKAPDDAVSRAVRAVLFNKDVHAYLAK